MAEELENRVARLEESERRAWAAIERLADRQTRLDEVLAVLAEAQIKTQEQFRETDRQLRETDRQFREADRRLDERIEKLVSAIAELIRNRPTQ